MRHRCESERRYHKQFSKARLVGFNEGSSGSSGKGFKSDCRR